MVTTGLSYKNLVRPELGISHHQADRKVVILVLIQVQPTTKVTKYETFLNFYHILCNYKYLNFYKKTLLIGKSINTD
jgi:hypothetical protein